MSFLVNLVITLAGNLALGLTGAALDDASHNKPQAYPTHQEQPVATPSHGASHKD
jgi:hypothetical protein